MNTIAAAIKPVIAASPNTTAAVSPVLGEESDVVDVEFPVVVLVTCVLCVDVLVSLVPEEDSVETSVAVVSVVVCESSLFSLSVTTVVIQRVAGCCFAVV